MGYFLLFLLFFLATLRKSRSWATKGACRWRKNSWWVSCSGLTDGMGGREGRELVGAIERTTAEAGGGYQHCIKRKIFFWTDEERGKRGRERAWRGGKIEFHRGERKVAWEELSQVLQLQLLCCLIFNCLPENQFAILVWIGRVICLSWSYLVFCVHTLFFFFSLLLGLLAYCYL